MIPVPAPAPFGPGAPPAPHDLTSPYAPWTLTSRYRLSRAFPWAKRPIATLDAPQHHVTVFTAIDGTDPGTHRTDVTTSIVVAELLDHSEPGMVSFVEFACDPGDVVVKAAEFCRWMHERHPHSRRPSDR
jgi:hypothetical protein